MIVFSAWFVFPAGESGNRSERIVRMTQRMFHFRTLPAKLPASFPASGACGGKGNCIVTHSIIITSGITRRTAADPIGCVQSRLNTLGVAVCCSYAATQCTHLPWKTCCVVLLFRRRLTQPSSFGDELSCSVRGQVHANSTVC